MFRSRNLPGKADRNNEIPLRISDRQADNLTSYIQIICMCKALLLYHTIQWYMSRIMLEMYQ
jgi:hypothetical protein